VGVATVLLTRGQINAVHAAFKAGINHQQLLGSLAYPNRTCARC
jgi:hypothetical protein